MPYLIVEGAIGAGKSSLLTSLQSSSLRETFSRIVVAPEPVERWESSGMLGKFYSNIARYAFDFQLFALETRVEELLKLEPADLLIGERSPWSDRYIFFQQLNESGFITAEQKAKYERRWTELVAKLPQQPTHCLYLDPGLDQCMARMQARGRPAEQNVTRDYQAQLRERYHNFLSQANYPIRILQSTRDYRESVTTQELIATELREFLTASI